jgi:hypothetical protein
MFELVKPLPGWLICRSLCKTLSDVLCAKQVMRRAYNAEAWDASMRMCIPSPMFASFTALQNLTGRMYMDSAFAFVLLSHGREEDAASLVTDSKYMHPLHAICKSWREGREDPLER